MFAAFNFYLKAFPGLPDACRMLLIDYQAIHFDDHLTPVAIAKR
jgi:hypothetical protein